MCRFFLDAFQQFELEQMFR